MRLILPALALMDLCLSLMMNNENNGNSYAPFICVAMESCDSLHLLIAIWALYPAIACGCSIDVSAFILP